MRPVRIGVSKLPLMNTNVKASKTTVVASGEFQGGSIEVGVLDKSQSFSKLAELKKAGTIVFDHPFGADLYMNVGADADNVSIIGMQEMRMGD